MRDPRSSAPRGASSAGDESLLIQDESAMTTSTPAEPAAIRLPSVMLVMMLILAGSGVWASNSENGTARAYTYESSDRGMAEVEIPAKGRTYDEVLRRFEAYRAWKAEPSLQLHRTSRPEWTNPLLWLDNVTHIRWKLSYVEPSQDPRVDYWLDMWKDTGEWVTQDLR